MSPSGVPEPCSTLGASGYGNAIHPTPGAGESPYRLVHRQPVRASSARRSPACPPYGRTLGKDGAVTATVLLVAVLPSVVRFQPPPLPRSRRRHVADSVIRASSPQANRPMGTQD